VLADITPVILTYNEAPNIGRSLERLTWARQVVIVDSGSTDETLAIAARYPNARAVHRPFDSLAQQWTFAVDHTGVETGWILRLDADYMFEPAFRD
jgi:glycosyltransferase involved in cell wall biosynthesis